MKSVKLVSVLILAAVLGGWFVVRSMTIYIPIGQVGIRIQQYSILGKKGIVQKDFGPGWHRDLGPVDDWELYDSTIQTLEMTKDPTKGSQMGRDDVKVQSVEGNNISLDVTVKYRLAPNRAYKLYVDTGRGTKYRAVVRTEAEEACIKHFGTLSTEDFYNPASKRTTAAKVKAALSLSLEENAIEIVDVLIRDVEFDKEYENKIRRKKLADQEVELNKSLGRAAAMRGKTEVIEAETMKLVNIIVREKEAELITMQAEADLTVAKIQAEYGKYETEKKADADLIVAQKDADGQRLVKKAEAEGERLRNEAIQGAGGNIIVALEAARNLNISEATVSTLLIDLLDVDGMVEKLGLGK